MFRDGHQGQGQPEGDLALDQFAAYTGFMHTAMPLFERNLDAGDGRVDRERGQGLAEADLDARHARRNPPRIDRDLPAAASRRLQGSRRPLWRAQHPRERRAADGVALPDQIVLGHLLHGGLRAYDISNPYQPKEIAAFVPPTPKGSPVTLSSSTTCSWTSAGSSTPQDRFQRGCTRWRGFLIFLSPSPRVGERSEGWGALEKRSESRLSPSPIFLASLEKSTSPPRRGEAR